MKEINKDNAVITGCYVIQAKAETLSPLVMGAGEGEFTDKAIVKNKQGIPVIPPTAFAGCLKNAYKKMFGQTSMDEHFWGTDKFTPENQHADSQSHLKIYPMPLNAGNYEIAVFDGIAISEKTGTVLAGAKYDYEAINNKVAFNVCLEINLRNCFNKDSFEKTIGNIVALFNQGLLSIGAFTSAGFGKLKFTGTQVFAFQFPADAAAWFQYRATGNMDKVKTLNLAQPILKNINAFSILADFRIKTALISGFGIAHSASDKASYQFNNQPALTGKSIKGAVSGRMAKILKTLCPEVSKTHLLQLTGYSEDKIRELTGAGQSTLQHKNKRSRFEVDFVCIENVESQLQDRIKIDRFTQGTIDGAKFDSEPVWRNGTGSNIKLKLTINNYQPWETGLLLQVLKDLWTGDLALGGEKNAGRGILEGIKATIEFNNQKVILHGNEGVSENTTLLEPFQNALNEFIHEQRTTTAAV
jgi:CRISPR/Cas system CSM-associated protein Csm3 (group 7 of RAMP superfamily)